jgi:hypothetical protein
MVLLNVMEQNLSYSIPGKITNKIVIRIIKLLKTVPVNAKFWMTLTLKPGKVSDWSPLKQLVVDWYNTLPIEVKQIC